jgi:hypothetical protein
MRLTVKARLASLVLVVAMLASTGALACPDCRLGVEVRARVFQEPFWSNQAITVLPLAVLAAIAAALHGIGRPNTSAGGER